MNAYRVPSSPDSNITARFQEALRGIPFSHLPGMNCPQIAFMHKLAYKTTFDQNDLIAIVNTAYVLTKPRSCDRRGQEFSFAEQVGKGNHSDRSLALRQLEEISHQLDKVQLNLTTPINLASKSSRDADLDREWKLRLDQNHGNHTGAAIEWAHGLIAKAVETIEQEVRKEEKRTTVPVTPSPNSMASNSAAALAGRALLTQ